MSAIDFPPADDNKGGPKDYRDMQVANEALVKADPSELQQLAVVFGWTPERTALESSYAQMRAGVVSVASDELDRRRENCQAPDEEERSLGAYKEALEPQVREAVLLLRRKGYNTYESGFYHFGASQRIGFDPAPEVPIAIPDDLLARWSDEGLSFDYERNGIEIHFDRVVPLETIRKIWNDVATALPDLGATAAPSVFSERFISYTKKRSQSL